MAHYQRWENITVSTSSFSKITPFVLPSNQPLFTLSLRTHHCARTIFPLLLRATSHCHFPPEDQVCFIHSIPLDDYCLPYWLYFEKGILVFVDSIHSALSWMVFVFYLCLCLSCLRRWIIVICIPRLKMNFLKRPLTIPLVCELGSLGNQRVVWA